VLAIDDSRSSLLHLQQLTERDSDIRAMAFLDPEAGLDAADKHRFDKVIVDHIVPKVDGITFIRRMRATDGHGQIPMVMLTATSDDAVRLAALEAGATDFLSKSQSPVELKVRLHNLIKLSDALRKLDDHVVEQAREIEKATQALRSEPTIHQVFGDRRVDLAAAVKPSCVIDVDVLPADREFDVHGAVNDPLSLARGLAAFEDRYDAIVVDTSPSIDVTTVAALTAAQYVLIPTQLNHLACMAEVRPLPPVSACRCVASSVMASPWLAATPLSSSQ
jgi:DNA-binding response OmpR family regulator